MLRPHTFKAITCHKFNDTNLQIIKKICVLYYLQNVQQLNTIHRTMRLVDYVECNQQQHEHKKNIYFIEIMLKQKHRRIIKKNELKLKL